MVDSLRITEMDTQIISIPLQKMLKTSIHNISKVYCLLVSLKTNTNLVGEGYAFCFEAERIKAISAYTKSLRNIVIGRDPHDVEAMWAEFQKQTNFFGQAGLSVIAYNPIDVACWDLISKSANQPLYKLFGACRDKVPVYASGGLWLSSSDEDLQREAIEFVEQGFKAVKMRLGSANWKDDVRRVSLVRQTIGEDITLMADANQGLNVSKAAVLGKALEEFNLEWFEEPVPTWNKDASHVLVKNLSMPIASAESEFLRFGIRSFVEKYAADVYMPDLQRMGGYTEMMKVVRYLGVYDLPVAPHIFTEHSLHIAASCANATWCEHMPWFEPLFNESMTILEDGTVALPKQPGIGFTFNWEVIDQYCLTEKDLVNYSN